jgi:hypothetical protein
MKYFPQEESSGDKYASLTNAQRKAIDRQFSRNLKAYHKQLDKLKGRISRQAWRFFALGFGDLGLHDARLLTLSVGDNLNFAVDRNQGSKARKQKTEVRILILNRKQTHLYSFVCTEIRKFLFNYPAQDPRWNSDQIELLETYELTSVNKRYLSLELLFSSNATLLVEFGQLKFKRQRLPRG